MVEETAQRLLWTASNMSLLGRIATEFESTRPFAGRRIGVSLHLEVKTAVLLLALKAGGADIVATGNYGTSQDDVVAYLNDQGIDARGSGSDSLERHLRHVEGVVDSNPDILLDNGADLVRGVIDRGLTVLGGTEETTSGHNILAGELAPRLNFPVIVINDSPLKALVENKHAVGQSTYESFCRHTNLMPQGKRVMVAGYGWCGRGIAQYMRANGCEVTVAEIDVPALDAETAERIPLGDALARHVLADGRSIDLIAEGRMLNLAGSQPKGNTIESMDMGFAMQARSLERVARDHASLPHGVHSPCRTTSIVHSHVSSPGRWATPSDPCRAGRIGGRCLRSRLGSPQRPCGQPCRWIGAAGSTAGGLGWVPVDPVSGAVG